MTRDVTQHPAFREAVEAMAKRSWKYNHAIGRLLGRAFVEWGDAHQHDKEAYCEVAQKDLTAALPFLERLYRETCAEELEGEMKPFVIHGSPEHISRETLRLAAAHLRRADA